MREEISTVVGALAGGLKMLRKSDRNTTWVQVAGFRVTPKLAYNWSVEEQTGQVVLNAVGPGGVTSVLYRRGQEISLLHVMTVHQCLGCFYNGMLRCYPKLKEMVVDPLNAAAE